MLFELHCHSTYSDGNGTPAQIIEHAKRIGLSGIAITDHDNLTGSLLALKHSSKDFKVIPAIEVSSVEGHIIGLNVLENIPKGLSALETVECIHSLGGLAIAAHPYDYWRGGVGDLILNIPFDCVEVINGHTFGNRKNPESVCRQVKLNMVGGSDAHTLQEIGLVTMEYEGDILSCLKTGNIVIHSKSISKLLLNHGMGLVKRKLF
jgi:predicted metal-dependent phosphoesterase TrpH